VTDDGRAERGALPADETTRLASVENLKQKGQRLGKWLTEKEAGHLLSVPDANTKIGLRDRAVACRLRARPRRAGPPGGESPAAPRRALGVIGFLGDGKTALRKGGKLGPAQPLGEDAIYTRVRKCGARAIGHPDLSPNDYGELAPSSAARREGNWNKYSFYWAMPPSKPPNATSALNKI
jgi:hypothetical protein